MAFGSHFYREDRLPSEWLRAARDGWADGVGKIGQLPTMHAPNGLQMGFSLDVAGAFPCSAAFAAGDPECMYVQTEQEQPRVVRLVLPASCPSTLDGCLATYAGAVSGLMQHIESEGITTSLVAATARSDSHNEGDAIRYSQVFTLRKSGDPLDVAAVAFALSPMGKLILLAAGVSRADFPVWWRSGVFGTSAGATPKDYLDAVGTVEGVETIAILSLSQLRDICPGNDRHHKTENCERLSVQQMTDILVREYQKQEAA